jgi:NADPH2:quinone reductase
VITARVPEAMLPGLAARLDQSMPVGNEGAGVVVETGSSDAARALMGKTLAVLGGSMYTQYRTVPLEACLALAEGTRPAEAASAFINPLTALGMVETMKREGHTALVHTAAASNLGQMLNRICHKDGIALVNIVRKPEQVEILRTLGATHVVSTESPTFKDELTEAVATTGATLAFDAIGGGKLANYILSAMETALSRKATAYSRYGSFTHKQVYLYGVLDTAPTELTRGYGMAWGIGGWLLTPFLLKIGREASNALKQRVAAELKTTFASRYAKEISLAEALSLDVLGAYSRRATGEKYLINPNKGL